MPAPSQSFTLFRYAGLLKIQLQRRSWAEWPRPAREIFGLLLLQGGEASLRMIQSAAVDGLIVFSMPKDDVTIRTVTERALPMVIVDDPIVPKIPFVGIDEGAAARTCAQHLRDLGHQRFAIVTFKLGADGHCGFIDRNRLKNSCYELNRHGSRSIFECSTTAAPAFL